MKKTIKISREDLKNNQYTKVKGNGKRTNNGKKEREELAILLSKIVGWFRRYKVWQKFPGKQ